MNKKVFYVLIIISVLISTGCKNKISISTNKEIDSLTTENKTTLIADTTISKNEINYKNTDFGFSINLPSSWKGYTIVIDKWEGYLLDDVAGDKNDSPNETGKIILIRHPFWTSKNPRQDIPIMIFTKQQWELVLNDNISLGTAPIGPSKLGENTKYVFALPARYNFAYLEGFEEVEKILEKGLTGTAWTGPRQQEQ